MVTDLKSCNFFPRSVENNSLFFVHCSISTTYNVSYHATSSWLTPAVTRPIPQKVKRAAGGNCWYRSDDWTFFVNFLVTPKNASIGNCKLFLVAHTNSRNSNNAQGLEYSSTSQRLKRVQIDSLRLLRNDSDVVSIYPQRHSWSIRLEGHPR
jgi:hypothetical protein